MFTTIKILGILFLLATIGCYTKTEEVQLSGPNEASTWSTELGGGCDGCELMYIGMPADIDSEDYSPGWASEGQKLAIKGKVYDEDGTPAANVVIYYWQTDAEGLYSKRDELPHANTVHGHLRGWVKTDAEGHYSINTVRPGSYPDQSNPAHVHFSILEPEAPNEYYIDNLHFDDDPFLTPEKRAAMKNRGGNGIDKVQVDGDVQLATRDIYLRRNIPNSPTRAD